MRRAVPLALALVAACGHRSQPDANAAPVHPTARPAPAASAQAASVSVAAPASRTAEPNPFPAVDACFFPRCGRELFASTHDALRALVLARATTQNRANGVDTDNLSLDPDHPQPTPAGGAIRATSMLTLNGVGWDRSENGFLSSNACVLLTVETADGWSVLDELGCSDLPGVVDSISVDELSFHGLADGSSVIAVRTHEYVASDGSSDGWGADDATGALYVCALGPSRCLAEVEVSELDVVEARDDAHGRRADTSGCAISWRIEPVIDATGITFTAARVQVDRDSHIRRGPLPEEAAALLGHHTFEELSAYVRDD